jgi:protein TonB
MRKLLIAALVSLVALSAVAGVLHISVKPGTVQGGTYSNPSLGIQYKIPEGWTGTVATPSPGAADHEFPLLKVYPANAAAGERVVALSVVAQKFLPDDQREDPAKFLTAAELAQRGALNGGHKREQVRPPYAYEVDGHPFFRAEWRLVAAKPGPALYETQVAGVVNGHILLLSAVSPAAEEANDLADSADDLQFAPPLTNDDPDAPPIIIQRKETPMKRVSIPEKEMRARLKSKVEPEYPHEARARGVQGEVLLDVLVGADGNVEDVTVVSGHPLLNDAALDAVKQWKFEPVEVDGVPAEADTKIRVTFSLISARNSS